MAPVNRKTKGNKNGSSNGTDDNQGTPAKEATGAAQQSKQKQSDSPSQVIAISLMVFGGCLLLVTAAISYFYVYLPSLPATEDQSDKSQTSFTVGNKTYHPSFGIFPKGCKWREVTTAGEEGAKYQFWDEATKEWNSTRPAACGVQAYPAPGPPGWEFYRGTPRTEVVPYPSHCVYTNLFYNNGRWYALVDGPNHVPIWRFSRNQEIITIHVENATTFTNSIKWRLVPGDTILFDFIFFIHPTAIGHWWEMLGPLYSILKTLDFKRPCDQFILLHLKRIHVFEWVRAMLAATLGVPNGEALPPVFMQEETDNVWNQITSRLDGTAPDEWIIFEKVLIVRDLYTGGGRTFLTHADGREFRSRIYTQYGLPPPTPRAAIPRIITYQRKRANRRILNEDDFIKLLKNYGEVRIVEFNSSFSLKQQLNVMTQTGVYVSVHTSNLANAPFLQPGSAVFEVIQRHWSWNGLDTSFRDQTYMMSDIHHYAWRARHLNQTVYISNRDVHKFGHWNNLECHTEECVEAHTNVDVRVDIAEFKALLDDRLPYVFAGASVEAAKLAWPAAD